MPARTYFAAETASRERVGGYLVLQRRPDRLKKQPSD
jgi:hypothetical protein